MHNHEFRVASVSIPPRCTEFTAEILHPIAAGITGAAGRKNPGHPYPVADLVSGDMISGTSDATDYLVTRNDGETWRWGSPLDLVNLGMADGAG
jgi:uncharacterized membrane protein YoaK (UPF0700 family)